MRIVFFIFIFLVFLFNYFCFFKIENVKWKYGLIVDFFKECNEDLLDKCFWGNFVFY